MCYYAIVRNCGYAVTFFLLCLPPSTTTVGALLCPEDDPQFTPTPTVKAGGASSYPRHRHAQTRQRRPGSRSVRGQQENNPRHAGSVWNLRKAGRQNPTPHTSAFGLNRPHYSYSQGRAPFRPLEPAACTSSLQSRKRHAPHSSKKGERQGSKSNSSAVEGLADPVRRGRADAIGGTLPLPGPSDLHAAVLGKYLAENLKETN